MRHGMRLPAVQRIVLAREDAENYSSQPKSLTGRHVWSPAGCQAIVHSAPVEVLNIAWARWNYVASESEAFTFVSRVSQAGRVDLLELLDGQALRTAVERCYEQDARTLSYSLDLACTGVAQQMDLVLHSILTPAMQHAQLHVLSWYVSRQRRYGDLVGQHHLDGRCWRRAIAITESDSQLRAFERLACAAALSFDPRTTLDYLCGTLFFEMGSVVADNVRLAYVHAAGIALVAVNECSNSSRRAFHSLVLR